jgi:hypothetical protein
MSENKHVFTQYCRLQQQITLVFSGLFVLLGLLSALYDGGYWAWTTFILVLIGTAAVNLLVATLYKVRKEGNNVVIENMWREKSYPVEALVEIRSLKFVIPYPFNPFVKFSFNEGRAFTGSIPQPLMVYLRRGGIRRYLENIREEWRAQAVGDKKNEKSNH